MPLPYLDLSDSATSNIAAPYLQLDGHRILCQTGFFSKTPEILPNAFFYCCIHK